MDERLTAIVDDLLDAIRGTLKKHEVTFDEYRAATAFFNDIAQTGEVMLLADLFLNQTICDIEMMRRSGTLSNVEGPYFLDNAPVVTDAIKVRGDVDPLIVRGQVTDTDGTPVAGVCIDIWHSDGEGNYSGFSDDFPVDYFRGKVMTDADGRYSVRTSVPAPYTITSGGGPTGKLLPKIGRQPWRPAHVHFKARKDGFETLTTQAYFRGGDHLDDDPVEAVLDDLVLDQAEDGGVPVMVRDFVLDRTAG